MKRGILLLVGFFAVAGGAALTGLTLARKNSATTATVREAQQASERAEQRVRDLRAQAEALEREAEALASRPAPVSTAKPAAGTVATPPAPGDEPDRERRREALARWVEDKRRPEAQVEQLGWQQERHRQIYGTFQRTQGMAPEVAQQFDAAYLKREARQLDLNTAARELGLEASDSAITKLRGEIFRDHRDEVRALLGEPGYEALQDYERTTAARSVVRAMAATAAVGGAPFTAEQVERLVGAIAAESSAYARGNTVTVGDVDWPAVREKLPQLLTPAQVSVVTSWEGGSGFFHSWWNGELVRATKAGKK